MKTLTMNPIPHRTDTPKSELRPIPSGIRAIRRRIAAALIRNTPAGLPTRRPAMIPSGTGSRSNLGERPSIDTPALAKAKTGRMPKATTG
jgi:hypothetical protein